MVIKCFKCGGEKIVKNGVVFGWQRYKCKGCGYQFTKTAPAGKPMHVKMLAHSLYSAGMSMRHIARVIGVTPQSVSRWINKWHTVYEKELNNRQVLSVTESEKLMEYIDVKAHRKCIVFSDTMPSDAKVHVIVQLPEGLDSSLLK